MEYIFIRHPDELELLRDKTTRYRDLLFSFSTRYLQTLKDLFNEKHAFQMFAKDDDGVFAGYIAAAEKSSFPGFLWIMELFIDQPYQGQGIGSALVEYVIQEAKSKNLSGLITQTEFENLPAQNLYTKMGFLQIDNLNWKDGVTYQLTF